MSTSRDWLAFAEELARWAVRRAGAPRRREHRSKRDPADLVTEVDLAIERRIRARIAERFPRHVVVGEEFGGRETSGPTWYVDPVDGTANFARGIPWASCSIAIVDRDRLLGGVVADLAAGSLVEGDLSDDGPVARVDESVTRCADVDGIAGEVVLTEWSGNRPWPGMRETLDRLAAAGCNVRIMGSSALAFACVARGWAAAALVGRYHRWDVLGGLAAAAAAGAVLFSRNGELDSTKPLDCWLPDDGILAAAPGAAEQVWRAWVG